MKFYLSLSLTSALSLLSVAQAQNAQDTQNTTQLDTIDVRAQVDLKKKKLNTKDTLYRSDLETMESPTLGDTLNRIPGVQGQSFGPASSLPVIRSLSGTRVSVLSNELDVGDVAAISANIGLAVEPMLADRITVEKTGASVLYGSRALGGVVNVEDNRIPKQRVQGKSFQGEVNVRDGYNSGHTQAFKLEGNMGQNLVWHIDGLNRNISKVRIRGNSKASFCHDESVIYTTNAYGLGVDSNLARLCQVSASTTSQQNPAYYRYINANYAQDLIDIGSEAEYYTNNTGRFDWGTFTQINNPANPDYVAGTSNSRISVPNPIRDFVTIKDGEIYNSYQHTKNIALGLSYVNERGHIGIGFSRYLNRYGVPGFTYLASGVGGAKPEVASVDMKHSRWALSAEQSIQRWGIEKIVLNTALTKSNDSEWLNTALAGNLALDLYQTRLEVHRQAWRNTEGIYGIDWKKRKLIATGPDNYMPSIRSYEQGVFGLEKVRFGQFTAEAGLRAGWVHNTVLNKDFNSGQNQLNRQDRQFNLTQKHLSVLWEPLKGLRIKTQRDLSERAPELNELYAAGRHFAIITDEQGNGALPKEKLNASNLSIEWNHQGFRAAANYYKMKFNNFIYLGNTGMNRDNLIIKQWRAADQQVKGTELELNYSWLTSSGQEWGVGVFADLVKSKALGNHMSRHVLDGEYLPGLPTSRYGATLDWQSERWKLSTALVHYKKQKYRGYYTRETEEIALPSYTLWDMYISYKHKMQGNEYTLYMDVRNILNKEARPYNSPLKYLAPLPGRSVAIGLKVNF